MNHKVTTMMLLAGTLLAQLGRAQQQDFSKVEIKVTKLSGNIYMLEGEGGNIAASVGDDGIVIVDDPFAPLADKIQAALKSLGITDKPVRLVIHTHDHGDHTGGNAPFANAGSTVIAQDNVRKRPATPRAKRSFSSLRTTWCRWTTILSATGSRISMSRAAEVSQEWPRQWRRCPPNSRPT
jgi:glyoxylase-like metal-dependent hydrolase (beta-lactamase superfamily II)